jgi:hypothetical protein
MAAAFNQPRCRLFQWAHAHLIAAANIICLFFSTLSRLHLQYFLHFSPFSFSAALHVFLSIFYTLFIVYKIWGRGM